MAHLQYIPGDPRLVDQLVYELKSKGIFDQFRKECIADVDTKPAYQNLRQRVENSVTTFLARQCWKPDLNKNQLREKLRKHILDGNYLEQGVERIVDQVVNPKVASVFIPQVEDLVYNYLGITRKKTTPAPETSSEKVLENDLLPTDLEAVSPGSVKSNDDKNDPMDVSDIGEDSKMEVDQEHKPKEDLKEDENSVTEVLDKEKMEPQDTIQSATNEIASDSSSMDKSSIPLPAEEIKLENIPAPENSPPKVKVELEKIQLPEELNLSTDIPLPEETTKREKVESFFKPISLNSEDDDSSSDSSLIRNMSPLTPIRNFNNENSCDAQQAFDNDSNDTKDEKKEILEPSTFRFTIETKSMKSPDAIKPEKREAEQSSLAYQFSNQVNINTFNTPMYDDSSNSNILHIDYESDVSKQNSENKVPEVDQNSEDSRKDKKHEERKTTRKSSHHRDSHRHSSSRDKKDSKQSSSKDSKSDKKSSKESKDDHKSSGKSSHKEKSSDRSDKRDSRESSKHRSSHKSSSSSHKDSKSHRSSSSSQKHSSSSKHSDEKRSSSSSNKDKSEKGSEKSSKEKTSKDPKSSSSSHRSDKDRKSSSSSRSKHDDKDKKKEKKEIDDHYSASGRGSHSRRSTDRDSNDGSTSSKGSHNPSSAKSADSKKEGKSSTSKSDGTTSSDSTSPSDKDNVGNELKNSQGTVIPQNKPIIRVENHLEIPIASPPRLPFVPDVTLKKPKFAANFEEAKKLMKMRKFLDEEQKRMNQEAALLLEFQANVRPSMSQVYSSISGPELEFACVTAAPTDVSEAHNRSNSSNETRSDTISDILNAAEKVDSLEGNTEDEVNKVVETASNETESVLIVKEVDEEVNDCDDKATVQLDNIMEIDTSSIQINENTSANDINIKEADVESSLNNVSITENCEKTVEPAAVVENVTEKDDIEQKLQTLLEDDNNHSFEVVIITEELSESETDCQPKTENKYEDITRNCPEESLLEYFAEHEKYNAELERDQFSKFLKSFTETTFKKMYLINCENYVESIIKEVSQTFGDFEIVNYYKNGCLKLNNTAKNVVKNVNVSSEISLPVNDTETSLTSPPLVFSPVKSECSFELSSDYDAKLEEMVSKTSRKEIMEIILGNAIDESTNDESETNMPTIDYCTESNIESDTEKDLKRKFCEVESTENNNRQVLTPNKIRKLSGSDQISSTTEESEESSNNMAPAINSSQPPRSKYLGRAKRVGLSRPKRCNLPNSPSSDKSVENYAQNTPVSTPNGKIKTQRNKVQRYDTSDLYKPKLHYLSRRNNIS